MSGRGWAGGYPYTLVAGKEGFTFAGDTSLWRDAAGTIVVGGHLQASGGDVTARLGGAGMVKIGTLGPSSQAGVSFGSASDTTLYCPTASVLTFFHTAGAVIEFNTKRVSDAGAPSAGAMRMYVKDGGTSRAQLYARFGTAGPVLLATEGDYAQAPDVLASGEATRDRRIGVSLSAALATNTVYLSMFTAQKTETISQVRCWSGTTAAGATPTDARLAVWSVAANGDLTLVAETANDTALFSAASTEYSKAFTASFTKTAGVRYAVGIRFVTAAAAPTAYQVGVESSAAIQDTINDLLPRQNALATWTAGAAPASITNASQSTTRRVPLFVLLP